MKKNKLGIIAVFIPILIGIIYFLFIKDKKTELSDLFVVEDFNNISKILITEINDTLTITFNKEKNSWNINHKYPATESSVNKLKQTLTEVKIKGPVKKEKIDSVNLALIKSGKKVQIFDKKSRTLKEWLIGKYEESTEGTYILNKNYKIPYLVNIPGLENDLNYRYNINSLYWIKTEVFSYKPNEIKEIDLTYPNLQSKSFKLIIEGNKAKLYLSDNKLITNINYNKLGSYLSYFMNVKFSSFYDLKKEKTDSLNLKIPDYIIKVTDIYNTEKSVKLYKIKIKDSNQFDPNKLNALINNEDLVLVKYIDIGLILRDPDYFMN